MEGREGFTIYTPSTETLASPVVQTEDPQSSPPCAAIILTRRRGNSDQPIPNSGWNCYDINASFAPLLRAMFPCLDPGEDHAVTTVVGVQAETHWKYRSTVSQTTAPAMVNGSGRHGANLHDQAPSARLSERFRRGNVDRRSCKPLSMGSVDGGLLKLWSRHARWSLRGTAKICHNVGRWDPRRQWRRAPCLTG